MRTSLTKLSWISLAKLREEQFLHLLDTDAGKRILNESFIDKLRARKLELDRAVWKIFSFNMLLIAVLFTNAFILPSGISISGWSAKDVGKLKELILFVSATLSLVASVMRIDSKYLKTIGRAWLRKQHGPEIASFSEELFGDILFELPPIYGPSRPHQFRTWVHKCFMFVLTVVWLGVMLAIVAANIGVYVTIIMDVVTSPSLPYYWSWFVIIYAGVAYLGYVLLGGYMNTPLPFRDYALVHELTELQKRDPDEHARRIRELARQRVSSVWRNLFQKR